jgi:hypothetical protein
MVQNEWGKQKKLKREQKCRSDFDCPRDHCQAWLIAVTVTRDQKLTLTVGAPGGGGLVSCRAGGLAGAAPGRPGRRDGHCACCWCTQRLHDQLLVSMAHPRRSAAVHVKFIFRQRWSNHHKKHIERKLKNMLFSDVLITVYWYYCPINFRLVMNFKFPQQRGK